MPLQLRPLREADLPAYDRIMLEAFSLGGLMTMFYPNGYTDADTHHTYKQTLKRMRDPNSHYKHMVVVDDELEPLPQDLEPLPSDLKQKSSDEAKGVVGQAELDEIKISTAGRIIGVSVWKFYEHDRSDEELEKDNAAAANEPLPPSADAKFLEAFFTKIGQGKKEVLGGKKHCLLHILATDPQHHRRGVGAKLLEWGLGEADRLGLLSYLEASEMGQPLYEKWGFETVRPMGFDARVLGAEKSLEHMIMVRPAKVNGKEA